MTYWPLSSGFLQQRWLTARQNHDSTKRHSCNLRPEAEVCHYKLDRDKQILRIVGCGSGSIAVVAAAQTSVHGNLLIDIEHKLIFQTVGNLLYIKKGQICFGLIAA